MAQTKCQPVFENLGSLITLQGSNTCLGFLMDFKERGVWNAVYGQVSVTPEHAIIHNKTLSDAIVKGLDEQCQIGQGNSFYLIEPALGKGGQVKITTFIGDVLASGSQVTITRPQGKRKITVTFVRNGRKFRGAWKRSDGDLVHFMRIE